jgi:ATP-dependent Lon protease
MDKIGRSEMIRSLPLIPLRDLVVFPSTLVPFIIGRPSSIQALEKAGAKDKLIFLTAQIDPSMDNPGQKDIYSVGVVAKIIRSIKMDEKNLKIIIEGKRRARVLEFVSTSPYFQVLVKEMAEIEGDIDESRDVLKRVLSLFEEYLKLSQNANFDSIIPALRDNSPDRIADIISSHIYLPLDEKQQLLETVNSMERMRRVNFILENEILKIHNKLKKDGKKGSRQKNPFRDPNQRIFPPGINMKKEEQSNEIEELRKKVDESKMPPDAAEKAKKEIDRLEAMPPMSAEATVCRNFLDWLINMPWTKKSREKRDLKLAEKILNEDHYGLDKVKERILEYLSIRQLVKNPKGVVLGFLGPPGVGKSSLGKSIARATGRKFVRLSLGGVRDEAEIRGHRRTYIGAYPGRIIQMIKRAGTKNPVFLLDEVDKMSMDFRGDPASALMEVLDPEQNNTFLDHYLDTDFDLSQVMFIVTANMLDPIPRPLIDRMEIIRLPGYTEDEKIQIGQRFLWPKQLKAHGLKDSQFSISDAAMRQIILEYTREAGVRNLERELTAVCRKMVRKVVTKGKTTKEIITPKSLKKYLGIAKFRRSKISQESEIGSALGLAWTEFGGEILNFDVTKVHGKGNFMLTGQLGEIMQESAQAAFSYVRGKMYAMEEAHDLHTSFDIHIHVPEGATPKEGPSAGITIATSIISLLLENPVKKSIAMTGEITLKGKVLGVGGIKEKLLAAHRERIKEVIIPKESEPDLMDLPKKIKEDLIIHLVEHMDQVLKIALDRDLSMDKSESSDPPPAEVKGGDSDEKDSQEPPLTH